jgi:hypothetical protein
MVTPALNILQLLSDINTLKVKVFVAKEMSVMKIHPATTVLTGLDQNIIGVNCAVLCFQI